MHFELDGYLPKVLSMDNLSPAPGGVGNADQYIAVLFPHSKTSESTPAQVQQSDSALIGHWRFDEGNGLNATSVTPRKVNNCS